MIGRITCWTTKFLSYAARVQLIKSVLFFIQTFWSQVFVLPKKIYKQIVATCQKFLWTGETEGSNKALIAWDTLCQPKSAGGEKFTDIEVWNKAAICKQFWSLCKKKDKLWILWVHAYYWKGTLIWETTCNQASWLLKKIINASKYVTQVGLSMSELLSMDQFSIRHMYHKLRGEYPKVPWRRLVCNNYGAPKWIFTLRLVAHEKLYIRDKLAKWGLLSNQLCPLCNLEEESIDHLFFKCGVAAEIGTKCYTGRESLDKQWDGMMRGIGL